jgi:hypothetical protein
MEDLPVLMPDCRKFIQHFQVFFIHLPANRPEILDEMLVFRIARES